MDGGIPEILVEWVRRRIGAFEVAQVCRAGSQRTGVWRLTAHGCEFYLKINRRRMRWATEVFVYRNWAGAWGPCAPEVVDVYEEREVYGILLRSLGGRPLREAGLSGAQAAAAYRRAGELCRQLHDLPGGQWYGVMDELGRPVDESGEVLAEGERDPVRYYTRAISRSLEAAEVARAIGPGEGAAVEGVLGALPGVRFTRPVPTGFDYTPGNWIADDTGWLLGVIDFENMAWGLRADPMVRLELDYFPECPEGAVAFYEGYGRRLSEEEWRHWQIGCALYALFHAAYATRDAGAVATQRARRAFAMLQRPVTARVG